MPEFVVVLQKDKETKNTVRYATDEEVPIDTVYVQKSAFNGEYPQSIIISVEFGNG